MSTFARILATLTIAAFSVGPVSAATVPNAHDLVAQGTASAQSGTITGTVLDAGGAPLANATVELRSGGAVYAATTNAQGAYTISNVPPGLYAITARHAGYETATEQTYAVIAGNNAPLSITMNVASFSSLRTIASVRTSGRGTFNTTTASVNQVSAQQFIDQSQPQVIHILNQIPGVQIAYPQGGGNAASPGAITFPSIRGGLGFETASLVDGHPLSVGGYGDYVTTFLSSYMLQSADVIKGPGAMSPQTNYAIGGTVNFRTKDPTLTPTPDYGFGIDNFGGSYYHIGMSDTLDRLGFVVELAGQNTNGGVNSIPVTISTNGAILQTAGGPVQLGYNDKGTYVPGTASQVYSQYGAIACCSVVQGDFNLMSELVKLRYKFSDSTTATVSYLGSQATADQNANTSDTAYGVFLPSLFAGPGQVYTGPIASGTPVGVQQNFYMVTNKETNNEPILQAEVATGIGRDTVLARYYHAGIQRLKKEGNDNPAIPQIATLTFNGVDPTYGPLNNVTAPARFYSYYNNPEIDSLNGYSFEWDHPIGDNTISLAYDATRSTTTIYSVGATTANGAFAGTSVSGTIPAGSGQNFQTIMGRGHFHVRPNLDATLALYDNLYRSTFLQNCLSATGTPTSCKYDFNGTPTNNPNFQTVNTSHFDERLGLEWRPSSSFAYRFSVGSSIAPPYIALLTTAANLPSYSPGAAYAVQSVNTGNIVPETAFGFDLGGDYRFKDGVTTLSGDVYSTNLHNQFISGYTYDSGLTCSSTSFPGSQCPANAVPLYYKGNVNLNRSRYEGIEARITRAPQVGYGYMLQGALTRAYTYDLAPTFYCAQPTIVSSGQSSCTPNQLLAVVPNVNFTGGVPSAGYGYPSSVGGGVNNINIPYLNAYAEFNYRFHNGAYAAFGYNVIGKNNWINEPAFGIANATVRYPVGKTISLQISGWNLFNTYSGHFPIAGAGVAVPLAAVPANAPPGSPALGATSGGQLGPAVYHFEFIKTFGATASDYNNP